MDITERKVGNFFIVDVTGKIDRLNDSVGLKSVITRLIEKGNSHIAVNLKRVTYIDSGALNVIIYGYNTLTKNGGDLVLIGPNNYVKDVLEIVGLNKIVKIYSTEEDFKHDKADN